MLGHGGGCSSLAALSRLRARQPVTRWRGRCCPGYRAHHCLRREERGEVSRCVPGGLLQAFREWAVGVL